MLQAIVVLALFFSGHALGADPYPSIWRCDATKFSWYCDEEEEAMAPPAPAPKPPPKPKTIQEMTTVEEVEKEMKRLLGVATMAPTEENVKAYAMAVEYVKSKAGTFADVWRRIAWQTPELNDVNARPANAVGLEAYNTARTAQKTRALADLAKDNGLFFFFRSDCPYCHKLAPTLLRFQAQYGIEIFPVSMDGKGLPDFPAFAPDRGASRYFGVDRVPALLLLTKPTGKVTPISFGMISLTEIEDRIFTLTQTNPGKE